MNVVHASSGATGEIRFAFGKGSLGVVLVAAGDNGIRAILMGEDEMRMRRDLAERCPEARLVADDAGLKEVVAAVVAFIDAPAGGLGLPLDIQGTAFERRVWQSLREIAAGSTSSYGAIARRLGHGATAQEVGAACAANPLAVAIPCHRLLKADGSISGYRWGVARKRALLAREGAVVGARRAQRSAPRIRP